MTPCTFNDDWPDEQRMPYRLILWRLLECYHTYCRSKIHGMYFGKQKELAKWKPGEHELGYAYEQMEYLSASSPIEALMFEVAAMILDGGRHLESTQFMKHYENRIQTILKGSDLKSMLGELPAEERQLFEHDLRLLKILE